MPPTAAVIRSTALLLIGLGSLLAIDSSCGSIRLVNDEVQSANSNAVKPGLESVLSRSELPAPSSLKRPSYVDSETFRGGGQFHKSWPNRNVEESYRDSAIFRPDPAPSGTGPAFAIYWFTGLETYEHDGLLRLKWEAANHYRNCWVGMPDFAADNWRWYAVSSGNAVQFDTAACINADYTYAAVVVCGEEPWRLTSIHLGSHQPPFITGVSPLLGNDQDEVVFTALLNIDPAEVTTWDWQFPSGFTPSTSRVANPAVMIDTDNGAHPCSVRVTNCYGESELNFEFTAYPPEYDPSLYTHVIDYSEEPDVPFGQTSIALEPGGQEYPHIAYLEQWTDELRHVSLSAGGWAIQVIDIVPGLDATPTMLACDSTGDCHLVYSNGAELRYAYTIQNIWQVTVIDDGSSSAMQSEFVYPVLAIDSNDLPHVCYMRTESDTDFEMESVHYRTYNGTGWSAPSEVVSTGGLQASGTLSWGCSLALDSNDQPWVAYHNQATGELRCAWLNGSWNDELVESGDDCMYLVGAINPLGNYPCLSYTIFDAGDNMLPVRYAYRDGTTWQFDTLTTLFDYGGFISLEFRSDGLPVIAYGCSEFGECQYAVFDGQSWSHGICDILTNYVQSADMAIDSTDRSHFSYRSVTSSEHCIRYSIRE